MNRHTEPHPGTSALLTIDVQRDFSLPGAPLEIAGTMDVLPNIRRLVDAFRADGRLIVHVVRLYAEDGSNVDPVRRAAVEGGLPALTPGSDGAELMDDLKKAMGERLAPKRREQVKGHLKIQQIFRASKIGNIAGCRVTDGSISRTDRLRLIREGRVIYTGEITSLKRVKDDVREVKEGFECGLKIANYEDIKEGDVVEAFSIVEEKRNL